MNINIPPALSGMGPVLSEFFEGMLFKLNVNSHKDALRSDDIDGLLAKMEDEIREFRDQRIQDADDPNILSELNDVANFAFLLYAYLRSKGVRTAREEFIDGYLRVDTEHGKVYCKKTRSGSPYKVGEEIKGTGSPVRIRTQHAVSGATISMLRRDLVWWQEYGYWPSGLVYKFPDYHMPPHTVDRLNNLFLPGEDGEIVDGEKKFPFVIQYKPKGRENTQNFGRWVYQRRHALKLVRVGYWSTAEEAAHEGLKKWKAKTRV